MRRLGLTTGLRGCVPLPRFASTASSGKANAGRRNGEVKLILMNLPYNISKSMLTQHIHDFGVKPTRVHIYRFPNGVSQGRAYASFQSIQEARQAKETLRSCRINDRTIAPRLIFEGPYTLVISNVPPHFSWRDLKDMLKPAGLAKNSNVYKLPNNKYIGMAEFKDKKLAETVAEYIQANPWNGMHFTVALHPSNADVEVATVRVRNFGSELSAEQMKDLFKLAGPVVRSTILENPNPSLRSCFISFGSLESVRRAVRFLNGYEWKEGSRILVQETETRGELVQQRNEEDALTAQIATSRECSNDS